MKGCLNPNVKIFKKLDLLTEYKLLASIGIVPDFENEIFVLEGYGAYMENYYEKSLKKYLKKYYQDLLDEGYQIVEGPAAPIANTHPEAKGLYLLNYENFLETDNKLKLK